MKIKRIIALFLFAAMLLSVCSGCGISGLTPGSEASPDMTGSPSPTFLSCLDGGKKYFADIERGDISYEDMEYEHYDPAAFTAIADEMKNCSASDMDQESFGELNSRLTDEIYYIITLVSLIDILYNRDPADEHLSAEYDYIEQVYYDAYDEFWLALRAVAESDNASLLREFYEPWQIDIISTYETDEHGEELALHESELERRYFTLIGEKKPDYDAIGELYVELAALRRETAEYYGYGSYAEYAYEALYMRNYSPSDAKKVHDFVKEYFVPILIKYNDLVSYRTEALYYNSRIDCSPEAILCALGETVGKISSEAKEAFDYMMEYGLYDITPSEDKSELGYTTMLYAYSEPFIFNKPYGSYYDYLDMFHEFGHFNSFFHAESDPLFGISDNDLLELQSQGMEVLSTLFYGDIFGEACGDAVKCKSIMGMVSSIVQGAMMDEFQQRIYSEPELTATRCNEIFNEVYSEYGSSPFPGSEHIWADISHNFSAPFYYISYCVSAIPALELFAIMQSSPEKAASVYLTVAAMNSEEYFFSEALKEAGLTSIFRKKAYISSSEAVLEFFSGVFGE